MLRFWRFVALLLAALGLALGGAHVLELQPRMQYEPALYATVTSTLYRMFAPAGAILQIGTIVASVVLAFLLRRHAAFRMALCAAAAFIVSLVLWAAIVAPVNAAWLHALQSVPGSVPDAYARLRPRWEYGHVAAFVAWLIGYVALLSAALDQRWETTSMRSGTSRARTRA